MAQFLYFVPGQVAAPPDLLADIGLAKVVGPGGVEFAPVEKGPAGEPGVVMTPGGGPRRGMGIVPAAQMWFPAGPEKRYWIGFDQEDRPGPEDLRREEFIEGADVVLGDGNLWHIPIARFFDGGTNLPVGFGLDPETGEEVHRVVAAHRGLFDLAIEWFNSYTGAEFDDQGNPVPPPAGNEEEAAEPAGVTYSRSKEIAAEAIRTNYRAGVYELGALELFDTDNVVKVCKVLADIGSMEKLMAEDGKKNGAGGQ